MNRTETTTVINAVAAAWPTPPMPTIVVEAWAQALAPCDANQAMDAVRELITTETYRPTPAQVVDLCRAASPPPQYRALPAPSAVDHADGLERVRALRQQIRNQHAQQERDLA